MTSTQTCGEPALNPALHVATDGSRNGDTAGYAFVLPDGRHGYGPVDADHDAELQAIIEVLRFAPAEVRLVIHTDSGEAIRRFVDQIPPKPKNRNLTQLATITELLAQRSADTEFRLVQQSVQTNDLHAVAHYLAFAGRMAMHLPDSEVEQVTYRILHAVDSNQEAHDMVIEHLFPTKHRARSSHD